LQISACARRACLPICPTDLLDTITRHPSLTDMTYREYADA